MAAAGSSMNEDKGLERLFHQEGLALPSDRPHPRARRPYCLLRCSSRLIRPSLPVFTSVRGSLLPCDRLTGSAKSWNVHHPSTASTTSPINRLPDLDLAFDPDLALASKSARRIQFPEELHP